MYDMTFFRKINNAYGSNSKKETTLYEIRDRIARTYTETIDYQPDTIVDGEPMPLIVMEPRGGGDERDRMKKIEAPPESIFRLGSKVDCFGLKWLVVRINYNQEIKLQGDMQLCNYILKWQEDDGAVVEEECVVTRYKTSASGEDASKVVTVDDTRRNVLVQLNERTARLYQGKRFFIDMEGLNNPKVYKLTDLDRTSFVYDGVGFFQLVCTQEMEIGGRDRPDLMLCDYIEQGAPLLLSIGTCGIDGLNTIRQNMSREYVARFFDTGGNEIQMDSVEWEILPPEMLAIDQITVLSQSDNRIELRCAGNASIGGSFTLVAAAKDTEHGKFMAEMNVEIRGVF